MKSLKSKLSKLAVFAFIGAFSFGLAISCVNAHKKETIKVSAEESDGTWTLSNGSLSFQFTDWQTNGYVTETNQIMVYGHGDGTFDISYELLGSPPGATTAGTEKIDEKTIQLTDGYWTPSETGGYGTVSGKPVNVNGLDSGTMITLNINVQYSGTMNEQNSGAGTTEPDGTWTLSNGSLSFQFTDWQTNGYVTETNQTMVYGHGDGTFDIGYELLGSPPGATSAGTELIAEKTIQLTRGYWTPGDTGYGTVTGYSVDVNGLDSGEMITLNIIVQYSGTMNEQGSGSIYYDSGEFYSREGGSDALVLSIIKFSGDTSYKNGSADLVFNNISGDNVGTLRMSPINFYPKPEGNGTPYSGTISGTIESTGQQVEDYIFDSGVQFLHEEVFDPDTAEWSWDSGARAYSCDYTPDSTGTTITYKALFLPPSGASGVDQIICEYTPESRVANVRTTIYNHNDGDPIETGMTKNFEFSLTSEPSLQGDDYYEFQFGTTSTNTFTIAAIYVSIVEEQIPEPPALSALEWYFDTDMGYFATNLYNDSYYSFALSTQINSVIFDRVNSTLTAHCTVTALDGNMPEEYYDAEMTFDYTFDSAGLEENTWHFYNAVCEATVEQTESLYFSVNVVSFRQIGWYFDEDLHYYVEEGVEASWNILHAEYRTEDSRNELILYMQVLYNDEYFNDVIQINNPNFDEAPYRGQTTLGTGVSGWSDKLQQRISLDINYVPFGYYANGWSYDPYFNQLVYINADDIDMEYQLTSASSNEGSYLLTYTCDGDSQSITVMEAVYQDEMLTGEVVLVENSDPITVNVSVPQSIIDGGTTSTYEYHICFDGNGATGGGMDDDVFTKDSYSFDYPLPDCGYEKDGYTFDGWATVAVDPVIKFQPGQTSSVRSVTQEYPTYTFYATWKKTNFTITFYPNGGSGTMEPITVANGAREVVPYCEFDYPGYEFVCWAVGSPTSSMKVTPDGQYSVTVTQDYDLYAVWEATGPVQHEGMWYDEESNRLRFYNTDLGGEQEVELEVTVLDFGPNTSLTRAEISAIIYYEDSIWETRSYDMRTFTVGDDSGRQFISGQLDLQDGEGERAVKLYVETLYNNVMSPGLNYVEGYNQIFYVNDQYDSSVVEFENVEINEITREAILEGYAVDVSGETDMHEFTITLTNALVNADEMHGDGQILTGYWPEIKKTITLTVFNITYNSLEEEPISPETIEEINNGMDKIDLSNEQKQQINDKIDENSDRIGESTGNAISQALDGTTSLMSDNPEFAEKQKEVIVIVVETVIDVETNKGSDIGQAKEVDANLPDNADLNVEKEIREFYERQMRELLGGEKQTRGITRALTPSYKIDVDISGLEDDKVIGHLDNEIASYGKMMNFIDSSVSHMSEAALKIRQCSGESVKISVKNYVTTVKISSFREFDKEAADAEFLENVYKAIMLHMQEQVINTLESEHKDSGNKEKEEVYQNELAAVKDYETFEIMVTEVLRQKYVALTGDETYTQENLENFFNDVYWPIFRAWALDEDIPQELKDKGINITLEQLTTTTIEQSTSRARAFTVHSDLQNNEIIFLAAFGGGVVLTISLAAIIPTIINKRRRGLVK